MILLLQLAYLVGSEVYYARSIAPDGILTVHDFFGRFGEPRSIWEVERNGKSYFEFVGHLPPGFVLATPSAPPEYVFDEQGKLVTWCSDPGDTPSYRQDWPRVTTNQIEVDLVKARFGVR